MTAVPVPPIMLFAAGFGTRMGALTRDLPKPMIPVAGRPLIDHTLDLAQQISPPTIVANLHYKPEPLITHLGPKGIVLSREDPDILDTGGGLKAALPLLGSDVVITMNTDAIWAGPNPVRLLLDQWDPAQMDGLLMCIPIGQTVGRKGNGDFSADAQGRISWTGDLVYGGVQIIKTQGLNAFNQPAFSMHLLWNQMLDAGRLFAAEYSGQWCDVGHPDGIALAEDLLASSDV